MGYLRFRLSARDLDPRAGTSGRHTLPEVEHLVVVDGTSRLVECAPGVSPELMRERTAAPYTEELSR